MADERNEMTARRSNPEQLGTPPRGTCSLPAEALERLERDGLLAVDGDPADGSGGPGWQLTAAGESAAISFLVSRVVPRARWADDSPKCSQEPTEFGTSS